MEGEKQIIVVYLPACDAFRPPVPALAIETPKGYPCKLVAPTTPFVIAAYRSNYAL
jgi:hypothetical protein